MERSGVKSYGKWLKCSVTRISIPMYKVGAYLRGNAAKKGFYICEQELFLANRFSYWHGSILS